MAVLGLGSVFLLYIAKATGIKISMGDRQESPSVPFLIFTTP